MSRLSRHQRWLIKRRDRELRPRGCPQPVFRLPPENPAPRPAWWGIPVMFRPWPKSPVSFGPPFAGVVEFELNTLGSLDGPFLITPARPFGTEEQT